MIVAINKIDKPGANAAEGPRGAAPARGHGRGDGRRGPGRRSLGAQEDRPRQAARGDRSSRPRCSSCKANPDRAAEGTVIEAKLDKGRGPLATVLVQRGTLKVGDIFVVGADQRQGPRDDRRQGPAGEGSRARRSRSRCSASPACRRPATRSPWSRTRRAPARSPPIARACSTASARPRAPVSLENMFARCKPTHGEGIPAGHQGRRPGLGRGDRQRAQQDLDRRDQGRASSTPASAGSPKATSPWPARRGAPIIGFNVRPNAKAREIAERDKVEFRYYDVIYHLTDWVKRGDGRRARARDHRDGRRPRRGPARSSRPASTTRRPACWSSKASSARACTPASPARTSSSPRRRSRRCGASRTTSPRCAPASNAASCWPTRTTSSRATISRPSRSRSARGRCDALPMREREPVKQAGFSCAKATLDAEPRPRLD